MKRIFILSLFIICFIMIQAKAQANDHVRSYPQEAYEEALDVAQMEGRLILLDFTAKWCTPCRWMKNTTFKDPTLMDYLAQRYVVVNIDIDDFEGYTLKEQYDVKLLPTFIVLNSKGEQLIKMEESMGASKMYRICKSLDKEKNIAMAKPASANVPEKEIFASHAPEVSSPTTVKQPTEAETEGPNEETPHPTPHFQLQLGVFNNFENARNLAEKITKRFEESVEIKQIGGRFKVLLGYFEEREEAQTKREQLQQSAINAIIIRI